MQLILLLGVTVNVGKDALERKIVLPRECLINLARLLF